MQQAAHHWRIKQVWQGQSPVKVDRILRDGDTVRLGEVVLTANHTPSHTRGPRRMVRLPGEARSGKDRRAAGLGEPGGVPAVRRQAEAGVRGPSRPRNGREESGAVKSSSPAPPNNRLQRMARRAAAATGALALTS